MQALTINFLETGMMPEMGESRYQEWSADLFHANRQTRLAVSELIFRNNRSRVYALGLFLACVMPIAQRTANRISSRFRRGELMADVLYGSAIEASIRMFQTGSVPENVLFARALNRVIHCGAFEVLRGKCAIAPHISMESISLHHRPKYEDAICAKERLQKVMDVAADLGSSPKQHRLGKTIQVIVSMGADEVLRSEGNPNWSRNDPVIDFSPLAKALGVSRGTAKEYVSDARKILRTRLADVEDLVA